MLLVFKMYKELSDGDKAMKSARSGAETPGTAYGVSVHSARLQWVRSLLVQFSATQPRETVCVVGAVETRLTFCERVVVCSK